jgi:hypothetical protein
MRKVQRWGPQSGLCIKILIEGWRLKAQAQIMKWIHHSTSQLLCLFSHSFIHLFSSSHFLPLPQCHPRFITSKCLISKEREEQEWKEGTEDETTTRVACGGWDASSGCPLMWGRVGPVEGSLQREERCKCRRGWPEKSVSSTQRRGVL